MRLPDKSRIQIKRGVCYTSKKALFQHIVDKSFGKKTFIYEDKGGFLNIFFVLLNRFIDKYKIKLLSLPSSWQN